MVGRVKAESQIHSNLQHVIKKLTDDGKLNTMYQDIKSIFENEVNYTLSSRIV